MIWIVFESIKYSVEEIEDMNNSPGFEFRQCSETCLIYPLLDFISKFEKLRHILQLLAFLDSLQSTLRTSGFNETSVAEVMQAMQVNLAN